MPLPRLISSRSAGWWYGAFVATAAVVAASTLAASSFHDVAIPTVVAAVGAASLLGFVPWRVAAEAGRILASAAVAAALWLAAVDLGHSDKASLREGPQFLAIAVFFGLNVFAMSLARAAVRAGDERRRQSEMEARWRLEDERHAELVAELRRVGTSRLRRMTVGAAIGAAVMLLLQRLRAGRVDP